MFEQTFKNIDDILHKDAGCGSELDYVEQTSWGIFIPSIYRTGEQRLVIYMDYISAFSAAIFQSSLR